MKFHLRSALIVCAALLAIGALPLEYRYYEALRAVVFIVAGFAAFFEWDRVKKATGWIYVFAWMAMFWNPIIPVHLPKGVWIVLDLAGAAAMLAYWRMVLRKTRHDIRL
ncbi:DUF6804 family protein [Nostoc sp. NIES-2111]